MCQRNRPPIAACARIHPRRSKAPRDARTIDPLPSMPAAIRREPASDARDRAMSAAPEPYVQNVLDKFDNVRASTTGWTARCPAHQDRKNSLSLGIGADGAVLVHCHVGCETGMVL